MKKINKRKTTDTFKEQYLARTIIPTLHFMGTRMYFPYLWNGETKYAMIRLESIIKATKWDIKL